MRPEAAMRCRLLRVKIQQPQHPHPMRSSPTTMGMAMARASAVPRRPPPPPPLEGGEGPAMRVSLNIALASGKKGWPGTGGLRHSMCNACMTGSR